MSLEIFARQSLAQFTIIYGEIFDGRAILPSELETLMWGRMCAKEAGIVKTGFKIPYDNIKRAKVTLPYMPHDINYTGCPVIKKNGGLYTPCCGKVAEDEFYCKTCSVDKEGNVKDLEFGTTETREANIEDEQFAPITFAEWMKGHKMTLPEVYSKLRDAGIAIEIPATELVCRELPKRRKGRPAKSDDSVVDEDSVEPKAAPKAKKVKAESEDEAPKKPKAKKVKAESDSEEEAPKVKAPKKAKSPVASPAPSEDEAPKKKAKSPAPSENEAPKKKAKSPVASEDDKAKKPKKAPKVESDSEEFDVKVAPTKKPKAEKAEKPKAEKPKAKAEKPKAEKAEKPKPKASSGSESDTPKKKKADPVPEPKTEVEVEEDEEEEIEEQEIEIDGKDYMLRNGKFICDMDDGRILGTVNDEGEPEWSA